MFECKTGIGRACRGHPVKAAPQGRQCRDHEAAEGRFRCRTVEEDPLHARVCGKKGSEIVGRDGGRNDAAVQAALALAAAQDIPKGEAGASQPFETGRVGEFGAGSHEGAQNFPEVISRVCIIFARAQGRIAGYAAENQGVGIVGCGRWKTVDQGHGIDEGSCVGVPKSSEITFCAIEQRRQAVVYPLNQ